MQLLNKFDSKNDGKIVSYDIIISFFSTEC